MTDFHGKIWWSELMTRDVEAARDYYQSVCGWTITGMPMPNNETYYLCKLGDQPVAGIMDMGHLTHMADIPPHWFTYLAVRDVNAAVAETRRGRGRIIRDCFDVPGVGRIAIILDPSGAAVGLITPAATSG